MLNTMVIENAIEKALIYERCGVSIIFIDLELIGKQKRQGHLNTHITDHKMTDVSVLSNNLSRSKLLVRINPVHKNSKEEIEEVISRGANIIMLPMFKEKKEVESFLNFINGRVKTSLLFETKESLINSSDILSLGDIDCAHIGLNDMHLSYDLNFIFETISKKIIDPLVEQFKSKSIPYGIGGIAPMDRGLLKGNLILKEYVRLGSTAVILSREFKKILSESENHLLNEIKILNQSYHKALKLTKTQIQSNFVHFCKEIDKIAQE